MLFIIYINDLLDDINSSPITSQEDVLSLQSDNDLLENWSNLWHSNFHPDKCHMLSLGKFDNIKHT